MPRQGGQSSASGEDGGLVYYFPGTNEPVLLSALLDELQPDLTENRYTTSVSDSALVSLKEQKGNITYNGRTIEKEHTLTALDYFDSVILTMEARNGKQTVEITLKNPEPARYTFRYAEETVLLADVFAALGVTGEIASADGAEETEAGWLAQVPSEVTVRFAGGGRAALTLERAEKTEYEYDIRKDD